MLFPSNENENEEPKEDPFELREEDVQNGKYGNFELHSFSDKDNLEMAIAEKEKYDQIKLYVKAAKSPSYIHLKTFSLSKEPNEE